MQPGDRFNVIRFDDTMDVLFPDTVPADAEHLGHAKAFVGALQASGGTEMVPAMRAALTDNAHDDADHVRQVVFLTDGAIGNEQQLFDTITAMRGRSRVFMVGIGSAPNTFLMTRAAELGRGTFTHIGSVEQVEERMRGLFAKLENPGRDRPDGEVLRARRPTSRRRSFPTSIAANRWCWRRKLDKLAGSVEIKGRIGDRPWIVHAAARERGRRQGPVQALGAAQDRRCRGGAHPAAGRPRRTPTRPSSRSRWSISW